MKLLGYWPRGWPKVVFFFPLEKSRMKMIQTFILFHLIGQLCPCPFSRRLLRSTFPSFCWRSSALWALPGEVADVDAPTQIVKVWSWKKCHWIRVSLQWLPYSYAEMPILLSCRVAWNFSHKLPHLSLTHGLRTFADFLLLSPSKPWQELSC